MADYSELELVIQQAFNGSFLAHARRRLKEGDSITPIVSIALEPTDPRFRDPCKCGPLLCQALFSPVELRSEFIKARELSKERGLPLRIRLRIEPSAERLHGIAWETLTDPDTPFGAEEHALLGESECVFSRYLFSRDFRLPKLRNQQGTNALIVAANPAGLNEKFAPIAANAIIDVARDAMSPLKVHTLPADQPATLNALANMIETHAVDILYLACHGSRSQGEAILWLEDEQGNAARVTGETFAHCIAGLEKPPTLVVLCSCLSAGSGSAESDVLMAVGPLLASKGIPAVLAMQGNFRLNTAAKFMPTFFSQLKKHGEVDRAVAFARAEIINEPDWWMPVVFTRLDNARIWYPPGFGGDDKNQQAWDPIIDNLRDEKCTPILGSTLNEALFGSRRELARSWGETYGYPLDDHDLDDLPQVAQFLAVTRQGKFPQHEFYKSVYRFILKQHASELPDQLRQLSDAQILEKLNSIISLVGKRFRQRNPDDPHRVLAGYPLPVYITTDPSDLLIDALREEGKAPKVRLFRWNHAAEVWDKNNEKRDGRVAANKATVDAPIVLKLFGTLDVPGTLVMTEDHYFDHLAKASTSNVSLPSIIRSRLNDSALLFIGLQVDSWEFRVLFRSLLQQEGKDLRDDYQHFSVQLDPNSLLDAASARRYIEKYLQTKASLRLYWGDTETFIHELNKNYRRPS
ncbi:CHAT domain-containing protein [Citrobacter braakii]